MTDFEYEEMENGEIHGYNPTADLNVESLESTVNMMSRTFPGKQPQELILSRFLQDRIIAGQLISNFYKSLFPNGCKIDDNLPEGKWFIKFY